MAEDRSRAVIRRHRQGWLVFRSNYLTACRFGLERPARQSVNSCTRKPEQGYQSRTPVIRRESIEPAAANVPPFAHPSYLLLEQYRHTALPPVPMSAWLYAELSVEHRSGRSSTMFPGGF